MGLLHPDYRSLRLYDYLNDGGEVDEKGTLQAAETGRQERQAKHRGQEEGLSQTDVRQDGVRE